MILTKLSGDAIFSLVVLLLSGGIIDVEPSVRHCPSECIPGLFFCVS